MIADRITDLAAIRRFVQVFENAHWQRNADAVLALFAADAVWTDAAGRCLTGLNEISDFISLRFRVFQGGVKQSYEVEQVTFPGDDVAAVTVRSRAVTDERVPVPGEPDEVQLHVLVRHKKDWLLVAGHSTFVLEAAVERQKQELESA